MFCGGSTVVDGWQFIQLLSSAKKQTTNKKNQLKEETINRRGRWRGRGRGRGKERGRRRRRGR